MPSDEASVVERRSLGTQTAPVCAEVSKYCDSSSHKNAATGENMILTSVPGCRQLHKTRASPLPRVAILLVEATLLVIRSHFQSAIGLH